MIYNLNVLIKNFRFLFLSSDIFGRNISKKTNRTWKFDNYFQMINHSKETRNNVSIKLPQVKLEVAS